MDLSRIRNTSIIAHIDHGKSTLADRMLELCGAVEAREMRAQYLDSMDLERERGITIKLQSVRLEWNDHIINLIDTPGHVDFGYEVSRSLAACEGVILVVDAAQGIEAQTLANCYLALENDLEIVAVLNKIDLPAADPDRYAEEIENVLGIPAEDILRMSAKTGEGVEGVLDAVLDRTPAPVGNADEPLQALIFDSHFDQYRGVVSSVRVMNGVMKSREKIRFIQANSVHEADEIGVRTPGSEPVDQLGPGEVGYLIAGIKDVGEAKSGETITTAHHGSDVALDGYREPNPMVFSGLYPIDGDEFALLRESLEKLALNDSSFTWEPETSGALGHGFRCGFLGLLHMEIVRERLEREFGLTLISTAPSVQYHVMRSNQEVEVIDNPSDMPDRAEIDSISEPYLVASILSPTDYTGALMDLCQSRRGVMLSMDYLSPERVELKYRMPLAEVVMDFFDQLKSRTQGYASLDYEPDGYDIADLVKVDILLHGDPVDAFSSIVHKDNAYTYGSKMAEKLKELIPRQQFDVPIQAAIGGSIIARETVKAYRKDVTAKLYGGDITRKNKLLQKQKAGKKRMKSIGRVDVPQEAFISALKLDDQHSPPRSIDRGQMAQTPVGLACIEMQWHAMCCMQQLPPVQLPVAPERPRRSFSRRSRLAMVLLLLSAAIPLTSLAAGADPGDSFADERVIDRLDEPTALGWLPDGAALITTKDGVLLLADLDAGRAEPYLSIPAVDATGARGLLDIAIAPDFASTGTVYVSYVEAGSTKLRVDSMTFTGDVEADAASRIPIWTNPGPPHSQFGEDHVGLSLTVGPDDMLYIAVGDGGSSTNAGLLTNVYGKILRIDRDGSIPLDNPFHDGSGSNADEIWALGLRDPQQVGFDSNRLFFGDGGGNIIGRSYNEINVGRAGANYGWPSCEGPTSGPKAGPACPSSSAGPVWSEVHQPNSTNRAAKTIAGAVARSAELPSNLYESYVYADFAQRELRALTLEGEGATESRLITSTDARSPIWVDIGPDGHLYYLHFSFIGNSSELRRLTYTGTGDRPPQITKATVSNSGGAAPTTVRFTALATDADGDAMSYVWDFGDGTSSAEANPTHTYAEPGSYEAVVTVRSADQDVRGAPITIAIGAEPDVSIIGPADGSRFIAGQRLNFDSVVEDNGFLDADAHRWDVGLSHDGHIHPLESGILGTDFSFVVPNSGHAYTDDTALVVTLTVVDAEGFESSDTIELKPNNVTLTIEASGLSFPAANVDAAAFTLPATLETVQDFRHDIDVPAQGCDGADAARFVRWSNDGYVDQTVVISPSPSTLTAEYENAGEACTGRPIGSFAQPVVQDRYDNEPLTFEGLATDDGTVSRVEWRIRDNETGLYLDPTSGQFTSGPRWTVLTPPATPTNYRPFTFDFDPPETGGEFRVQLRILDDDGRLGRPVVRDLFIGRDAATIPRCEGRAPTVVLGRGGYGEPTQGPDVILGTRHADEIDGLGGDDIICGLNGADVIDGGAGDDVLIGGGGPDTLLGGGGNDTIFGGNGPDKLRGGDDDDTLRGESDVDDVAGNAGNDTLFGGEGRDTVRGGIGDDVVRGGGGRDVVYGGNGDDYLGGAASIDICYTGQGQDDYERCEFVEANPAAPN